MKLIAPDYSSTLWAEIPAEHRAEIRSLLNRFSMAPPRGLTAWLEEQAKALGMTYSSLRSKYYALRNSGGDWTVLIDKRRADTLPAPAATARTPRFVAFLLTLVEQNGRKSAPAFKELRRKWRMREPIPGYEGFPGWDAYPAGWSDRNLAEIVQAETNKAAMRSIRVGTSSKTNPYLPTVLTTRVGMWPQKVIQIDDQWHDNYVTIGRGKTLQVVRVLELGALDVYSGHRFTWGARPRRLKATGGWETIAGKDVRLFIAGMLHTYGYAPQGTMIMSEHNTAKIDDDIARTLYDTTGGMVRVDYQPIEGKQAALNGYWAGTEGGNFRAKAHLESVHNAIRNAAGHLPMQTGSFSSGIAGSVFTERQFAYIQRVLKDVLAKVPHRADLLRLPTLDFHTQFIPWLEDYYHFGLASRTDHELEGWARLGGEVSEYTLAPGSGAYLSEKEFLALEDTTRAMLSTQIKLDPARWTRRRKLSPLEMWKRDRARPHPVPPAVICDLLGGDLARPVVCRRGFLTFEDQEIAPDPLVYQGTFISGPRAGRDIPWGEKVNMFALPFADSTAIAVDAKGRFLGELALYKRLNPVNDEAFGSSAPYDQRPEIRSEELRKAAGVKHERIAGILEPVRIRHAERVQEARDLRAHNKDLADPSRPFTPEEIAAVETARSATAFGHAVREAAPPPPAAPAPDEVWSDVPDHSAPEAFDHKPQPPIEKW